MRHVQHRRSAPGVKNGTVQRKNNWRFSPDYDITPQPHPFIDRQRAGPGYRHLLLKRDIERFIDILPDWPELSRGLNAIVLAPGSRRDLGYHRPGIVALCAWDRELVEDWDLDFFLDHASILERLGVPINQDVLSPTPLNKIRCHFTEDTARAFQLLNVLLHELGHHHDHMTTRSRRWACRGENFAEQYARRYADRIWDRYLAAFDRR